MSKTALALIVGLSAARPWGMAAAEGCTYDGAFYKGSVYAAKPAAKLQSIPVYNQEDHGWCWAYSTAQMIDACLLREGMAGAPFVPSSAIFFPVKLAKGYDEGHFTDDLLNIWEKVKPRCHADRRTVIFALARAIFHDGQSFSLEGNKLVNLVLREESLKLKGLHADRMMHRAIENLVRLTQKMRTDGLSLREGPGRDKLLKVCMKFVKATYQTRGEEELEDLTLLCMGSLQDTGWDFIKAGASAMETIMVQTEPFLRDEKQLQCVPDNGKCLPRHPAGKAQWPPEIDARLAEGVPVAIDYCSSIMAKGKGAAGSLLSASDDECGMHVALLVGKRVEKGVKQYLLRNSWGTGCDAGQYGDNECRCGHVWLNAKVLLDNTQQVSWVK